APTPPTPHQSRTCVARPLPARFQSVHHPPASLTPAAAAALYAQTLFIMLAVPGALVALGLAYLAALGTADRDRRDLALLRARGASRRDLFGLAVAESALLGALAGLVGAAVGIAAAGSSSPPASA